MYKAMEQCVLGYAQLANPEDGCVREGYKDQEGEAEGVLHSAGTEGEPIEVEIPKVTKDHEAELIPHRTLLQSSSKSSIFSCDEQLKK